GRAVDLARWTHRARHGPRHVRCSCAAGATQIADGPVNDCDQVATWSLALAMQVLTDGIYLKREDEHELGAFKWRGAQAVLEQLRPPVVVTASTGNHGAATAWAAKRAGGRVIVLVPQQASTAKVALIQAQGAELYRVGADMDEAKAAARAYAAEHDAFFFEDGAETAQFDGYEAIGEELLDELPEAAAVVVPGGNGALAVGGFRA